MKYSHKENAYALILSIVGTAEGEYLSAEQSLIKMGANECSEEKRTTPWRGVSDEELIHLLKGKIQILGYIPTQAEVRKDPEMPSPTLYAKRFKSWKRAIRLTNQKEEVE